MGNETSNSYWEAELPPNYDRVGIDNFIRAKYNHKLEIVIICLFLFYCNYNDDLTQAKGSLHCLLGMKRRDGFLGVGIQNLLQG